MTSENNENKNDILDNITGLDAMRILRIFINKHQEFNEEINKIAHDILIKVDMEEIANDVENALNCIQVEELWDRSGGTRYGYIEPSEESWVMFEEVLDPFINDMLRYQKIGLTKESKIYCLGIISGIKSFDLNSTSEFKDWAVDAPYNFIEQVFDKWKFSNPDILDINEVENYINEDEDIEDEDNEEEDDYIKKVSDYI